MFVLISKPFSCADTTLTHISQRTHASPPSPAYTIRTCRNHQTQPPNNHATSTTASHLRKPTPLLGQLPLVIKAVPQALTHVFPMTHVSSVMHVPHRPAWQHHPTTPSPQMMPTLSIKAWRKTWLLITDCIERSTAMQSRRPSVYAWNKACCRTRPLHSLWPVLHICNSRKK